MAAGVYVTRAGAYVEDGVPEERVTHAGAYVEFGTWEERVTGAGMYVEAVKNAPALLGFGTCVRGSRCRCRKYKAQRYKTR